MRSLSKKATVVYRTKNSKENNWWDLIGSNISKITAYYFVTSLIFGLLKLNIYYQKIFNIPIFSYVDVYDILFIAPATVLAHYVLYMFFVAVTIFDFQMHRLKEVFLSSLLITPAIIFAFMNLAYSSSVFGDRFHLLLTIILMSPIIILVIAVVTFRKFFVKVLLLEFFILFPLLSVVFVGVCDSILHAYVVKNTAYYERVIIKEKNGGFFKTSKNFKYIGRTKSAVFFYDLVNKSTRIVNAEDIKTWEFKTLK